MKSTSEQLLVNLILEVVIFYNHLLFYYITILITSFKISRALNNKWLFYDLLLNIMTIAAGNSLDSVIALLKNLSMTPLTL